MTARKHALRILFVDQAVGFGGSIVVVSRLLECLRGPDISAFVTGEMDERILAHHFAGRAPFFILRRRLNYVHMARLSRLLRRWPLPGLYRLGMYAFTLAAACANLPYMIRLGRLILREHIDILHINQQENTQAILTGLALGRKVVVHAHGTGPLGLARRWTTPRIGRFIAISEYIKKDLIVNRIPRRGISVVPNPTIARPLTRTGVERARAAYRITPGQRTFGIVGRLVPWKGQREFLLAARLVLAQEINARAFIVGDVSDGDKAFIDELRTMARESGFGDRITFTGYIQDVHHIYGALDVVVHASTAPEPFGLVITEAMAYGIPVVASNLGATPEIITDGYDGVLIDPARPEDMANAVSTLLRDDALRTRMGARAKETVEDHYNGNRYAQRMREIYQDVLGSS